MCGPGAAHRAPNAAQAQPRGPLTWPHLQTTRLQPPFFSTGLVHLGQGLVLAASQLRVSLSPLTFSSHISHILQVQGLWGALAHLKQNTSPHAHSGST